MGAVFKTSRLRESISSRYADGNDIRQDWMWMKLLKVLCTQCVRSCLMAYVDCRQRGVEELGELKLVQKVE